MNEKKELKERLRFVISKYKKGLDYIEIQSLENEILVVIDDYLKTEW